jgi:tetratricopeptide (TPR) repeat protein
LLSAAKAGGKDAVRRAAESYRLDPVNRYHDLALRMSRAAEFLNNAKQPEQALLVAQLTTEHYPNYRDAFLVLGFLAEANGRKEVARDAAKRALQLDPNNRLARTLVERLAP